MSSPEPGLKKQLGIYQRAQKHDSDAEQDIDVACSFVSASVDETMRYIDDHLKDLRNMIHPNEWNNIPACVRSAIMGLIDFNDAITQRLNQEDFILHRKISQFEDKGRRQKHDIMIKMNEIDKKIEREQIKAVRATKKSHEEIYK